MGTLIATAVATFLAGLALGVWACYIYVCKPERETSENLLQHVITMRKQGFVPQFELEQAVAPDLTAHIREY